MHAELTLSLSSILGFVLVLTRMLGVFSFVPLPGKDSGPSMARIVFAFGVALALFPRWPRIDPSTITLGVLAVWLISEAALGLTVGLLVSFLSEALTVGAHILGLQAGYAYASVIDPTTQADSDVLQVVAQLTGGLLFFTGGLDHFVIRAFALSLDSYPPGRFVLTNELVTAVTHLGSSIFAVGLRLAFPVVALLLLTEIALALVGRISSQLQLGQNAGPVKMMITLLVLVNVLQVMPRLYEGYADRVLQFVKSYFQHP